MSRTLAVWLNAHPKTVASILLATLLGSLLVMPHLKIQAGTEPFIDRSLEEKHTVDRVNAKFGSDAFMMVAIKSPTLFSAAMLQELRDLGEASLKLSVPQRDGKMLNPIDDVTSLATVKDLQGLDLSFRTVPLVEAPVPQDSQALANIKERALLSPVIRDNLLSPDLSTTTVMLRMVGELDDDANASAVKAVRALLDSLRERHPGTITALTGDPVVRADTAHYMEVDLERFIPLVYLLCLGVLIFLFRTWRAVVVVVINITLCLLAGMAGLTLIGGTVNNLSTILPPVLVVVATATMIHFLSELARHARTHGEALAPVMTMTELLEPQFMCALTTAVGFVSLSVSNLPAMQEFGIAAAIANMVGLAISFMVASLMAHLWPAQKLVAMRGSVLSERFDRWVNRYTDLIIARPKSSLAAALSLIAIGVVGMTLIVVDMRTLESFSTNVPVRRDSDFFEATMGGTTVILVSVRAERERAFLEPEAMHRLDRVAAFLKIRANATQVMSVTDHVKLMNRAFMGEAPAEYRIPNTREQVAQLLLLNGDPMVDQYIDTSYRWVRIMARTAERSSAETGAIYRDLDRFLASEFPAAEGYVEAVGAGESRVWSVIENQVVWSQINTFGLSFLLIFGPIFLMFRSVVAGLFSIPSNIFPIILTMGLMGFSGIYLDIGTVMTASVVLGIAVDDTIHFLTHIRSGLRSGASLEDALRHTLHMKGAGAIWTAMLLCAGFGVVLVSNFAPTRNFGLLTCSAMITGVIGEILLLPPMLLLTQTRLGITPPEPTSLPTAPETGPLRSDLA